VWSRSSPQTTPQGEVEGARQAAAEAIADQVVSGPTRFKAHELSCILSSFARMGYSAPEAFTKAAAYQIKGQASQLNPEGLSLVLWAFTRFRQSHAPRPMLEALATEAARKAAFFGPEEMASTAWGFASLGFPAPRVFDAFAKEGPRLVKDMSGKGLATLAWAYQRVRHNAPTLMGFIPPRLIDKAAVGELSIGEMAMALHAYGENGHRSPALFKQLGKMACERAGELSPGEAAMVLRACAKAGRNPVGLYETLAGRMACCSSDAKPQELAMAAWALGKASHKCEAFEDALATEIVGRPAEFSPQELSNVLYPLAKLKYSESALQDVCTTIEGEIGRRRAEFKQRDLQMLCSSFSSSGYRDPAVCKEVRAAALERPAKSSTQGGGKGPPGGRRVASKSKSKKNNRQ